MHLITFKFNLSKDAFAHTVKKLIILVHIHTSLFSSSEFLRCCINLVKRGTLAWRDRVPLRPHAIRSDEFKLSCKFSISPISLSSFVLCLDFLRLFGLSSGGGGDCSSDEWVPFLATLTSSMLSCCSCISSLSEPVHAVMKKFICITRKRQGSNFVNSS